MDELKIGMYKHFKGGLVRVIQIATHSETLEKFVVYEACYECRTYGLGSIWVRPLSMFKESVEVKGKLVPRFEFVN
ncbi:DUF1653 domain-containing protein [Candidatus Woesearchaeota archaeon]|jgi:hypothetical protein|nr:DUF1653 domain-containing protein [Candidatus Woesearchaeota archaeon]